MVPDFPELLKTMVTSPVSPGRTGFCVQLGAVHPQVVLTLKRINGCTPSLTKRNTFSALSPWVSVPKSNTSSSKIMLGPVAGGEVASDSGD